MAYGVRFALLILMLAVLLPKASIQTVRVDITPSHVANTFRPTETLGAGVDRIPLAATEKTFTEPMIKRIPNSSQSVAQPIPTGQL